MTFDTHPLFAYSSIQTVVSQSASVLIVTIPVGDIGRFAINEQVVIWPTGTALPLIANAMVCRITAISSNQLTINVQSAVREGSTTRTVLVGDQIIAGFTPKALTDIEGQVNTNQTNIATNTTSITTLNGRMPVGTVVGNTDVQTLTNKTIGDTLNTTTGNITQTGSAAHITLTPGTSKLVKFSVLRQDDTTNAYKNNCVILTGWGQMDMANGAADTSDTVTFGLTFTTYPIVVPQIAGYTLGAVTDLTSFASPIKDISFTQGFGGDSITTTGFRVSLHASGTAGAITHYAYTWIAIGQF